MLSNRRLGALLLSAVALTLSGCDRGGIQAEESGPSVLVVSENWVASQRDDDEGAEVARARIASLQAAITRLREETGTGWIGRQDDVTGFLADLSGGSRPGAVATLMDDYGAELFGLDSTGLQLGDPDTETVPGVVTTRATQVFGGVPVLDGQLLFTGRRGDVGTDDDRVTGARGRVFGGLQVSTQPTLARREAALIAARAAEGKVAGRSKLKIVPTGAGILTWEVNIVAASAEGADPGMYYVDAHTGDIVTTRPTTAEGAASLPRAGTSAPYGAAVTQAPAALAEPDPNSVVVTGADPWGRPVTANGRRTDGGVELVDTTTPAWKQGSGKGGIYTYDATGVGDAAMPGKLVVSPDVEIRDPEALAAHGQAREVIEYFEGLGRSSWDGEGGSLVTAVNYGPSTECNAYFDWGNKPMMIFGNPCASSGRANASFVDIDVTAHEVTHGVTSKTAALVYSGQPGALNESFSDYFGNVIGNLVNGTDSVALSENMCMGITEPSTWCNPNPDGTTSVRYMLNGNDYDQYLRILDVGRRLDLLGYNQDQGGVHFNSAIWNNALWSIRTQLAKIDNLPGNESPLARAFDRAVYGALATRLSSTSGFLDARAAVEQVIIDSSLDPVVLRVARETFDANKICAGCQTDSSSVGDIVSATPATQLHPAIAGDRVAWLERSNALAWGQVATSQVGGSGASMGSSTDVMAFGFAGEAVVTLEERGRVLHTSASGDERVLAEVDPWRTFFGGLAGSDAGAAWVGPGEELAFVDPSGNVTTTALPGLAGDTLTGVGTGGGYVAAGTDGGKVFGWEPGSDPVELGSMSGAVLTLAAYDGNVLAIDDAWQARLFTADGRVLDVSRDASPYGAALSSEYAVWAEATSALSSGVLPGGQGGFDTDLHLLSLRTGKIYKQVAAGGQQAFPALSGRRLVWQDAVFSGDDIMTALLPEGL